MAETPSAAVRSVRFEPPAIDMPETGTGSAGDERTLPGSFGLSDGFQDVGRRRLAGGLAGGWGGRRSGSIPGGPSAPVEEGPASLPECSLKADSQPEKDQKGVAHMATLEVRELKNRYSRTGPEVLKGISFNVEADDFFAIIGPSGAGKSTLIRCINRLVEPSGGDVILNGANITRMGGRELRRARRNMGMIFQEFNLVERMSVMDNVLSGRLGYVGNFRSLLRMYPKSDVQKALELLERVGLGEFVDNRADELSGGQRQRVGIARALMQNPKLLLVDEPTSSLDPKIAREVMGMIKKMSEEAGVPVLCNIHDVQLALEFASKVIGLQDGIKKFEGPTGDVDKSTLDEIYAMEVL